MSGAEDYSRLDRLVHRLAFARPAVQLSAADMEDGMFARDIAGVALDRPIFVTSLPRAGTTVLLTALAKSPMLAAHTYRDMPFVMAPLLWSRLSGSFRKSAALRERAHGDGMHIGYDSPEAFEEVVWKTFWPGHYKDDGIVLWQATDRNAEGEAFLARHMRKIVALRCGKNATQGRYISKNNANIARLPLIAQAFPDARIVVPVRSPLEHAASLLRQHLNFLDQHGREPFVRRYMADIGHLEFGALHRPIAFPGFAERARGLDPRDIDYWLAYWIAAFNHVAAADPGIILVSHEALAGSGARGVTRLCAAIGVEPGPELSAMAAAFREVAPRAGDHGADPTLAAEAETLHARLVASSLMVNQT
ncbi:MAG: sulfotransferase [Rhodobacteraceae bacterium]|nr:sulfotransferase [Paracoccaceae bacterium]